MAKHRGASRSHSAQGAAGASGPGRAARVEKGSRPNKDISRRPDAETWIVTQTPAAKEPETVRNYSSLNINSAASRMTGKRLHQRDEWSPMCPPADRKTNQTPVYKAIKGGGGLYSGPGLFSAM